MATILKGYQFRLYPNNEQKKLINQTIGCSRFIYNHFLEERINEYKKTGRTLTCYEQIKEIPQLCKSYPWLKEVESAVIRRDGFKYYVSVLVEVPLIEHPFQPKSIVGLDLGIKDLIITSHNEKIENTLLKIKRAYMKLKNIRKHLIHDITNKIIKDNDIIVMEDLDIKARYQTKSIAKHLVNIPLAEIKRVLEYKCLWQNRDINASINIMFEGLKIYMQSLI